MGGPRAVLDRAACPIPCPVPDPRPRSVLPSPGSGSSRPAGGAVGRRAARTHTRASALYKREAGSHSSFLRARGGGSGALAVPQGDQDRDRLLPAGSARSPASLGRSKPNRCLLRRLLSSRTMFRHGSRRAKAASPGPGAERLRGGRDRGEGAGTALIPPQPGPARPGLAWPALERPRGSGGLPELPRAL